MPRKRPGRKRIVAVAVFALLILVITIVDMWIMFRMTSQRIRDAGSYQLAAISGELESTINEAEKLTLKYALEAQRYIDDKAELERIIYERRDELMASNNGAFNLYIAGSDWNILPGMEDPDFVPTERDWYKGAIRAGGATYVTAPYVDVITGNICYTVSDMLPDGDTVISVDYTLENIQVHIASIDEDVERTAVIVTGDGIIAGCSDEEMIGKKLINELPDYAGIFSLAKNSSDVAVSRVHDGLLYDNLFGVRSGNGWYLIVSIPDWELYKDSYLQLIAMILISVGLFAIIVVLWILATRNRTVHRFINDKTQVNRRFRIMILSFMVFVMLITLYTNILATYRWGREMIHSDADTYESQLDEWVDTQKSILDMFCSIISTHPEMLEDYEGTVDYLNRITVQYPEISVTYMSNPDLPIPVIMNNGWQPAPGWRVDERQWYIDTLESESGWSISAPYYDEQTGGYCVTISERVYDASTGEFLGNFGIDFFMDKLVNILGTSYSSSGYAFLADTEGYIINHPYGSYQMSQENKTNVSALKYSEVRADTDAPVIIRDYDGVHRVVLAKRSQMTNFVIYVAANVKSIYGRMFLYVIVSFVAFVICIALVRMLLTNMISWQEQTNRRIKEAADEAIAAGQAKSRFLAQMSHEIRTPINAVLGMNEMILHESRERDILDYAANIQSSGRTLLSIINTILDFSKIEDGKMEIIPVRYDTLALINNLVNSINDRAVNKGLELDVRIDRNLPSAMMGDDVRIAQVIMNLLTNAVKYTEEGTVILAISEQKREDDSIFIRVRVSDTGIGIRDEDMEKLFESFGRLEEKRNHNIEGTGLGMSIVTGLLEMMDSKLDVESEYGVGSTFSFVIEQKIVDDTPIGDYDSRSMQHPEIKSNPLHLYAPSAAVLVVDDNDMNLKVAANLLKLYGIIPDLASSGQEAIDRIKEHSYDVILLDHMMPGMDGIETLEHLKEHSMITEGMCVIALTANAVMGAREKYLQAGFDDYLSKPIEITELEAKLSAYLPEYKISFVHEETADISGDSGDIIEFAPDTGEEETMEFAPYEGAGPEEDTSLDEVIAFLSENGIDTGAGLRHCNNEKDFYIEILTDYVETYESRLSELTASYSSGDWNDYQTYIHALKSMNKTIGASEESEDARVLEGAAEDGDIEYINKHHDDFLLKYERCVKLVRDALGRAVK